MNSIFFPHRSWPSDGFDQIITRFFGNNLRSKQLTLQFTSLKSITSLPVGTCMRIHTIVHGTISSPWFLDYITNIETFFPLFQLFPLSKIFFVLFFDLILTCNIILTQNLLLTIILFHNIFLFSFFHQSFSSLSRKFSKNMLTSNNIILSTYFFVMLSHHLYFSIIIHKLFVVSVYLIVKHLFLITFLHRKWITIFLTGDDGLLTFIPVILNSNSSS